MPEEQNTTAATTEVVAGNAPEARTPDGAIVDQQGKQPSTKETPTPEAKDPKPGASSTPSSKPEGAPEKYEFKPPEGQQLDAKLIESVTPVFKELGLSQDQANKLFEAYTKQSAAAAEAVYKPYTEMQADWRSKVFNDPALGDGTGLKAEIKGRIDRALNNVGGAELTVEFKKAFDLTGAGSHPAVIKMMNKFAEAVGEGTLVNGKGPSPLGQQAPNSKPKSAASALYPNLPSSSNG